MTLEHRFDRFHVRLADSSEQKVDFAAWGVGTDVLQQRLVLVPIALRQDGDTGGTAADRKFAIPVSYKTPYSGKALTAAGIPEPGRAAHHRLFQRLTIVPAVLPLK